MKWFVFVMFVVNQPNDPNAYLFTTPSFDSLQQCQLSVTDLNQVPMYADKLAREFNGAPTIKSISCINEETVRQIDEFVLQRKGKST